MEQAGACGVPITCGIDIGFSYGPMMEGDKIPIYEGAEQYIYTIYSANLCVSELYNEQEKKITLITNGPHYNFSNPNVYNSIKVLIPKDLLGNITYTVDGKYPITYGSNNYGTAGHNQSEIEIDLPLSFDTKKIEIMGDQKIPEFPFAIPILLISIVSIIVFYRIKFGNHTL